MLLQQILRVSQRSQGSTARGKVPLSSICQPQTLLSPPHEQKPEPPLKPGQRPAYSRCCYSQFLCGSAQTATLSGKREHSDVIKIEQSAHGYLLHQCASRGREFRAKVYSILKSADVKCQTDCLVCSYAKAVCNHATFPPQPFSVMDLHAEQPRPEWLAAANVRMSFKPWSLRLRKFRNTFSQSRSYSR
jgi:hypothetical protein